MPPAPSSSATLTSRLRFLPSALILRDHLHSRPWPISGQLSPTPIKHRRLRTTARRHPRPPPPDPRHPYPGVKTRTPRQRPTPPRERRRNPKRRPRPRRVLRLPRGKIAVKGTVVDTSPRRIAVRASLVVLTLCSDVEICMQAYGLGRKPTNPYAQGHSFSPLWVSITYAIMYPQKRTHNKC